MKLHSLKLTIQDLKAKGGEDVACISGSLLIDEGKDEIIDGKLTRVYNTINFVTSLDTVPEFKKQIQTMIVEALALKKMEIEREELFVSHTIKQLQDRAKKRVSKTRVKKK